MRKASRRGSSASRHRQLKPYERHTPLDPAARIIARLGGPHVVAKVTGTAFTAPYRWQTPRDRGGTGGTIPQRYHLPLLKHARAARVRLTRVDFFPIEHC